MQTIVMASRKGGAGKTTLSSLLAVEAERQAAGPVVLIDTDPQGGLAAWWNAREAATPAFAQVGQDIGTTLADLAARGARLAIIDTPPAVSDSLAAIIALATLVVVPVRASPNDLRAVAATVEIIEQAGKPMLFVINAVKPRVRLTGEAAIALSQHGTVAPTMIWDRADYAGAMTDGRTAPELDQKGRAADEVATLWGYIADRLARIP